MFLWKQKSTTQYTWNVFDMTPLCYDQNERLEDD